MSGTKAKKVMTEAIRKSLLAHFQHWCESLDMKDPKNQDYAEQDFYALSIGFFAALGADKDTQFDLALKARYDHHYWQDR